MSAMETGHQGQVALRALCVLSHEGIAKAMLPRVGLDDQDAPRLL